MLCVINILKMFRFIVLNKKNGKKICENGVFEIVF